MSKLLPQNQAKVESLSTDEKEFINFVRSYGSIKAIERRFCAGRLEVVTRVEFDKDLKA